MRATFLAFLIALAGAYGVFLLYTSVVLGWRGRRVSPGVGVARSERALRDFLVQAGLDGIRPVELAAVEVVLFSVAAAFGFAIYGGWVTALTVGAAAASVPVASARGRRRARQELARESWPRLIEEIRLEAVTLGRSIPQALLSVGRRAPAEMQAAFAAAHREWSISTDFDRTLNVLKSQLADPTADAVCETLLIAHEVGGTDVDQRLRALIDDRTADLQGRKDARSKQAGVRFARLFVLIVPFGMAAVGLTIGDGRAAYGTARGQTLIMVAFACMAACWMWAAALLRLPAEDRVFRDDGTAGGS